MHSVSSAMAVSINWLHHKGGAVVHVDSVGEVEYHDLMIADVNADGVNPTCWRMRRKSSP